MDTPNLTAQTVIGLPIRLGFAITGVALSAVESAVAVARVSAEGVQNEINHALGINSDLLADTRSPLEILSHVAELLGPDRPIGRALEAGGPVDRLLRHNGVVDRLTGSDGILERLVEREEPLAAIIAQVPHLSGLAAVRATGVRQAARLLPAALEDTVRALFHRPPRYVDSVGRPGSRAIMVTPDAWPGVAKMAAADGLTLTDIPLTVAARAALRIGTYSPLRHAGAVMCPALIQVTADDALCPTSATRKALSRMADARLESYPGQHFDVYVEPLFDTVVADQIAFLRLVAPVAR